VRAKQALPAAILTAAVAGGIGVVASPAWASGDVTTQACVLNASGVSVKNNLLTGTGGRSGCSNTATLKISLYEEIPWWPDDMLASITKSGTNFSETISASCTTLPGNYYVEVTSSTGNVKEGRHSDPCH
jgi:hypothetical protein